MTAAILPLLTTLALGCGGKQLAAQNAALAGRWTPATEDGQDQLEVITIVNEGGTARVVSIVDYDDEAFEIQGSGWDGDRFEWTYRVPSTGFVVKTVVTEITDDRLSTRWSNDQEEGDETLVRLP